VPEASSPRSLRKKTERTPQQREGGSSAARAAGEGTGRGGGGAGGGQEGLRKGEDKKGSKGGLDFVIGQYILIEVE
jgi:hypothetical protein